MEADPEAGPTTMHLFPVGEEGTAFAAAIKQEDGSIHLSKPCSLRSWRTAIGTLKHARIHADQASAVAAEMEERFV